MGYKLTTKRKMPLIPWRPFHELERWFEDWPEFEGATDREIPRMDIYQKDNDIIAEVELPGVDLKDINVEVKDNVLTVEAKKKKEEKEEKKGYYRRELSTGYYKRRVRLPEGVKSGETKAKYEDGVLKIIVPREKQKEEKKGKKVKIESK